MGICSNNERVRALEEKVENLQALIENRVKSDAFQILCEGVNELTGRFDKLAENRISELERLVNNQIEVLAQVSLRLNSTRKLANDLNKIDWGKLEADSAKAFEIIGKAGDHDKQIADLDQRLGQISDNQKQLKRDAAIVHRMRKQHPQYPDFTSLCNNGAAYFDLLKKYHIRNERELHNLIEAGILVNQLRELLK